MALLEGNGITMLFGGLMALSHVDLSLNQGEILGLIGPNGAGKTTLFNVITGVYHPTHGTIRFRGDAISSLSPDRICKKGISRTYQLVRTFQGLTVLENVLVGQFFGTGDHHSSTAKGSRFEVIEILKFMGILDKADQSVERLAIGDRKKVEIARALATNPEVLLLDESVAGLNPSEIEEVLNVIREIRTRGISVIIIEHHMRAIMGLSDRIMVLHHGEKIAEGKPQEVANDPEVIKAYLGE